MFDEDEHPTYLDLLVQDYEQREEILNALEDSRFGEIYLYDHKESKQ